MPIYLKTLGRTYSLTALHTSKRLQSCKHTQREKRFTFPRPVILAGKTLCASYCPLLYMNSTPTFFVLLQGSVNSVSSVYAVGKAGPSPAGEVNVLAKRNPYGSSGNLDAWNLHENNSPPIFTKYIRKFL